MGLTVATQQTTLTDRLLNQVLSWGEKIEILRRIECHVSNGQNRILFTAIRRKHDHTFILPLDDLTPRIGNKQVNPQKILSGVLRRADESRRSFRIIPRGRTTRQGALSTMRTSYTMHVKVVILACCTTTPSPIPLDKSMSFCMVALPIRERWATWPNTYMLPTMSAGLMKCRHKKTTLFLNHAPTSVPASYFPPLRPIAERRIGEPRGTAGRDRYSPLLPTPRQSVMYTTPHTAHESTRAHVALSD